MSDPFTADPDATRADCPLPRPRGRWKAEATVGLGDSGEPKRKKPADFSAVQRRWFEQHGWTFARVEHANAWGRVSVDLWGFADWIAVKQGEGVLLVQTCRQADMATRARKASGRPELRVWLEAGGRFVIHGWRQPGGPGTRWEAVEREIVVEPLPGPRGEGEAE